MIKLLPFIIILSIFLPNSIVYKPSPQQEKPAESELVLTWTMLKDVTYVKKPHPDYGIIQQPVFGESLKKINGKKVVIKGFIIPLDFEEYALSKTVYASCYFCGQEGPETVMGIEFKKLTKKLKTDMSVTLKGKFVLNPNDPDNWMFNLKQAEIVAID
jgi:hypothetical protein